MGWILVNLLLPATLPLLFMTMMRLGSLPEPFLTRSGLLRIIQDGQLGWVAMSFAAASTYDLWQLMSREEVLRSAWSGILFSLGVILMVVSAVFSIAGTLFPIDHRPRRFGTLAGWLLHYKLRVGSITILYLAAVLYSTIHFEWFVPS